MKIPGVCQKKGQTYRRFKVKGADGKWRDHYVKLPDPTDPRFAEELARVNGAAEAPAKAVAGTIRALAADFRVALDGGWTKKKRRKGAKAISANTRRNYDRYIDMLVDSHGGEFVRDLTPANVYALRDKMGETPGKANNWLSVLKLMLTFAGERGWINTNPAADVGLLPVGEHDPWPADVLVEALEAASPMLRLAIVTGLCTGQRVSDCIKIQHNWLRSGIMEMSQLKTAVDVAVPVHPWWRAEIDKLEKRATTVLYDRFGKPFTGSDRIQERVRVLMHSLGHVDDDGQLLYTFHGLRKNACCYLLEAGLPDTDVGSLLGMSTETVRHYGKRAKALMIARRTADVVAASTVSKLGR